MISEVSPLATVVLDSSGNGQCSIGPPSGTWWALRLATLATSTATKQPQGLLYRGSSTGPLELVDNTYTGSSDSSGKVGGTAYYPGQRLWAVWRGGDAGATATLQAYGRQGARSDPFELGPVGEGFANPVVSQLIAGSPGGIRIVIGQAPPPELVAASTDFVWTTAIVEYDSTGSYVFEAVGTYLGAQPVYAQGSYSATTGIVFWVIAVNGTGALLNGSDTYNTTALLWRYRNGTFLLDTTCDFQIDSVSQGRGLVDFVSSVAASAAIGAEAIVLTGSSITWRDGRAYEVCMHGFTLSSVANVCQYKIRKTNLAGTILQILLQDQMLATGGTGVMQEASCQIVRAAGAGDLTANIVLTLLATAGTCTMDAGATYPRWLSIRDIGADTAYPNAVAIS